MRVSDQEFVMGGNYGGRVRGGSTSRQEGYESSKGKKESKPAGVKISAEEIRKLVAKF